MSYQYQNIYQLGRENTGITQEKASELLDISVESLRAYENDKRIPPNTVVVKMISIYNNNLLGYEHVRRTTEAGVMFLPKLEMKSLSSITLKLHKEIKDYLKKEDDFIDIVEDDVIDAEEEKVWNDVMQELEDIFKSILILKLSKKTK
ncbi:helix-turn-helix domain-containing protein [Clostridioides difficile]|uniref:helix-turn-helix domain-containing protein n=1 Tax=Clostridioides difficile TaxID=1496 RepID=UPI000D6417D8|nr:helix-turn-helix transcriptional regulator [Clostridioides difficile]MCR1470213.1 helix-turn-helix transcriptional regulator [Clostridioides difficile]MCU5933914.1 helix-turn-helix transcriptional regulator [Clostridioides difficile]MDS6170964.1 helix-turn-helix transcriptional regulator [Clostridioides difficile]VFD35535.1 putative prophage LambdaCh01, transcriptional regulator [Clostridioides difficile]VHX80124.1 putative prophage LambdaCh01, transcriptional regulator [Clostridioides diff